MSIQKSYIDTDVLIEARKRARIIFERHDSVVVSFSGGKDSLAALHIMWEAAQEFGHKKLNVCFRDEELIPDAVVDFVHQYQKLPWIDMLYLAVPLASNKFILGKSIDYVQWTPNREWLRPKPEFAVTNKDLGVGENKVWDQYNTDGMVASRYKGKVAIVTGIRAAESLVRFRSCVNKLSDNWLNASPSKKAILAKPIYDWVENDVFRYFYDENIAYCSIYDAQTFAGAALRVSTPLHAEQSKIIGRFRATAPTFYDQVMTLYPEMLVQERYWSQLDRQSVAEEYAQNIEGIQRWIDDNLKGDRHRLATKALAGIKVRWINRPENYPFDYILNHFVTGAWKRELQPLKAKKK